MERTIGAFDARRQFGKLLSEVAGHGDAYVVERHGAPIAAVVPIRMYEQWKRGRDAFFDRLEETARHANLDEDAGMALALEAQAAVRAARRGEDA